MRRLILMGVLFFLPLQAEEMVLESGLDVPSPIEREEEPLPTPQIKELIEEVKNAPDEKKRLLINQLKIRLKSMKRESRHKAMVELKKSFATKERHLNEQQPKEQQRNYQKSNASQQGNHQPKFRHLRRGPRDGSGPKRGRGGGSHHQGSGQK